MIIPNFPTIYPISPEMLLDPLTAANIAGSPASAVWPTANLAIFVPFTLHEPFNATQLVVTNGAAVSGNFDLGIYALDGTRLVSSGSTAQAGTQVNQSVNTTDIILDSGSYYLGCAFDNTTAQIWRYSPSLPYTKASGCYEMASAFPLPAAATFATMANAYIPLIWATSRSYI